MKNKNTLTLFIVVITVIAGYFFVFEKNAKRELEVLANTDTADQISIELLDGIISELPYNNNQKEISNNIQKKKNINQENILNIINLERTKRGLLPLKQNISLDNAAIEKNADMFDFQYFSHNSPHNDDKDFSYFIDKQNYHFIRVSENLAMGDFATAQEVVDAWMKSVTHKANIIFPHYTETGISVEYGNMEGKKVVSIVQYFGVPRAVCPTISESIVSLMKSLEKDALDAHESVEDLQSELDLTEKLEKRDTIISTLIEKYNTSVRTYNQLVKDFRTIKEEYDKQLKSYETCIRKLD